ncbi:calcium/sodium antiporter [Phenylobacterium sp.]|uniref:calcium/sodium antiporter n=1 Tax=Phenylobacterium sp. TaxID=1871053 RepID=UPI0028963520|nr:calcium/sodium antiporter [Phenylobacterium sp.]
MAGLVVLLVGAEFVTRGGGKLAAQLGVPPILIGLTVVAVGTSAPEFAVGVDAALRGAGALAVGNIAGTNTVNLLLILGLSAAMRPLELQMQTIHLDLPVMIVAALMMLALAFDGSLSRLDGVVLVLAGVAYTVALVVIARRESRRVRRQFEQEYPAPRRRRPDYLAIARSAASLLVGIAVIVVAADWLVDGAVRLARIWEVSDAFIGLTIVAIGTSAPELATTIVSTLKNEREIALGNLLGSSIYNILIILGGTALIPSSIPVPPELIAIDIPIMVVVALVCAPVFLSGRRVSRWEGGAFVGAYALYLTYLLVART